MGFLYRVERPNWWIVEEIVIHLLLGVADRLGRHIMECKEASGERKSESIYILCLSSWIDKTALKPKEWGKEEKPVALRVGNLALKRYATIGCSLDLCSCFLCISKCRFPLNMHNLDITFRFSLLFDNLNAWSSSHDYFIHTSWVRCYHISCTCCPLCSFTHKCAHSAVPWSLQHHPLYRSPWANKRSLVFATQWLPFHMSNKFKLCKHPRQPVTPMPSE